MYTDDIYKVFVSTCRYFTLFMKLLNECSDELEGGKEKGQVTGLRNVTVQAMSNLLSANIDSGLMHSISMYTIVCTHVYVCLCICTCILYVHVYCMFRYMSIV